MGILKVLGVVSPILVFLSFFFTIVGLHIETTSNGQHTGYVTAIETNGLIFKTDSVYFKTDAESSQEDRYCVIDDSVKQELINVQKNKELITIKYISWLFTGWNNCKMSDIAIIIGVN